MTVALPNGAPRAGRVCAELGVERRGAVALLFAMAVPAVLAAIGIAINMGELADARAALQRSVDLAALSGAAAYSLNSSAYNALAIRTATTAYCNSTSKLPLGATTVSQSGAQPCAGSAGPLVSAVTDSYVTGTPGVTHAGISCTGTYLPPAPYNCGFIVTVSASVTLHPIIPSIFGVNATVSATGMAANPFISFAKIFSLPAGVQGGAKYANSVWAYALALNSSGAIDYSSNAGGLPDASLCSGGPDEVTCGAYVMLGNTIYSAAGAGYTPPGQTVIYDNGVVRNPASPTQITATTPLGIAFKSSAGGNYVQYPTAPGVYGYQPQVAGVFANPATYLRAANTACIYPYSNLVYNTVTQTWTTKTTTTGGVTTTSFLPQLPWPTVTHWFYSSYLTSNTPPSQGEIVGQVTNNQDILSVPLDTAQAGGNIQGKSTYNANPSPAVPTTVAACPATSTVHGASVPNDMHTTSTFPATGLDNCSLYVVAADTPGQIAPNASYTGSCFDPSNTPGQTYAAQSCQAYGSRYYTFFWNDMGGANADDKNYANGIVQLSCASASHVVLIQ